MNVSQYDVIIVGAGFAGIYMLHKMKQQGLQARVFEAGAGVGGTWFWNRYPGARCDIPSMQYSYQFSEDLQQSWNWQEKYATQAEILDYAEHVVERFGLRDDMQFNTRVTAAVFDEASKRWQVQLSPSNLTAGRVLKAGADLGKSAGADTVADIAAGDNASVGAAAAGEGASEGAKGGAGLELAEAKYIVMATGCLSVPNYPQIPGLEDFKGPIYHTGCWPQEGVDFTGQGVVMIGTGSSAIQSSPIIADQASALTIFQRTPNYSIPARNEPLDPEYVSNLKARYREYRDENWQRAFGADFNDNNQSALEVSAEERQAAYEERWRVGGLGFMAAYNDLVVDDKANATARAFFRDKISEQVSSPEVAEKLMPDFPIGCKRLCVDTDYYAIYNLPHVQLVDIKQEPIAAVTPGSIKTASREFKADAIVLATGFDAMTGAVTKIDIRGRGGLSLKDKWAKGPRAYLGLATQGFPNLFLVTGPGSPSVLSNMLPSIEQHVEWIADCIQYLNDHQHQVIDVNKTAEDSWVAHVNELGDATVFPRCNSWYLGSNIEGKERVFMPYLGVPPYVEKCRQVAEGGYEGFEISA